MLYEYVETGSGNRRTYSFQGSGVHIMKITKEYLIEVYIERNLTMAEVAKELNCGKSTVKRHIDAFGIKKEKITKKSPIKGKIAVNNGSAVAYINKGDEIPEGFVLGGYNNRTHESYIEAGKRAQELKQKPGQTSLMKK